MLLRELEHAVDRRVRVDVAAGVALRAAARKQQLGARARLDPRVERLRLERPSIEAHRVFERRHRFGCGGGTPRGRAHAVVVTGRQRAIVVVRDLAVARLGRVELAEHLGRATVHVHALFGRRLFVQERAQQPVREAVAVRRLGQREAALGRELEQAEQAIGVGPGDLGQQRQLEALAEDARLRQQRARLGAERVELRAQHVARGLRRLDLRRIERAQPVLTAVREQRAHDFLHEQRIARGRAMHRQRQRLRQVWAPVSSAR